MGDIDMYNRVREMFSICTAEDSRENDYAEGFDNFLENVGSTCVKWDNKSLRLRTPRQLGKLVLICMPAVRVHSYEQMRTDAL